MNANKENHISEGQSARKTAPASGQRQEAERAYLETAAAVLEREKSALTGLSQEEAARRLESFGPNKLAEGKKTPLWRRFLGELADPMILMLIAAAVVSGITSAYAGESFADVIIIMIVVVINAVLGVYQESKAEKAIDALEQMTKATAKVIRGGQQQSVPSEQLVPGDVIVLEAGDAVPAEGRVLESASMKVIEAALTGESVAVSKTAEALQISSEAKDVPLGDRKNMVYTGSTVDYGRGMAVVTGTGMNTEMGRIADALTMAKNSETPLQRKLNQLSKILTLLVLGICAVIFAVNLLRAPEVNGQVVLNTFMIAVSLAVAAIPEGLAAVVTIVLSIGVTRMSERRAVIRKLTAVETLGCTQVICSDKTGTLTQNKMTVVERLCGDEGELLRGMALCSDAVPDEQGEAVGEATECALVNDATKSGFNKRTEAESYPRLAEAPFDSMRKMMSVVLRLPDGRLMQYTKGAPDEILARCSRVLTPAGEQPLDEAERGRYTAGNKQMADKALRVLALARREWKALPKDTSPEALEQDLCLVGLSGMIDPIRPEVKAAIAECHGAGIRTVMITGDHKDTAVAIANQLGILKDGKRAVTGAELSDIPQERFREEIKDIAVYARVQPEHKVRIVQTWQENGMVTAMTGDGVNDAPSIKNADIGIGMGITGTDVTKSVADMVLADDNFATIVAAVEEGRRIYDNIRKAIQFLLSSNLAEVIAIFAATMLGFVILEPVHLLWINLITDCFPAVALGMEPAEADIMRHKPRDAREGVFAGGMGFDIFFQGAVIAGLTVLSFIIGDFIETGVWQFTDSKDGMTMAFLTLSMVEIFHSLNMRSRRHSIFAMKTQNKYLYASMLAALVLTTAVIYVPFLSTAFDFTHISAFEYGVALLLAVSIIPIMEVTKAVQRMLEG